MVGAGDKASEFNQGFEPFHLSINRRKIFREDIFIHAADTFQLGLLLRSGRCFLTFVGAI